LATESSEGIEKNSKLCSHEKEQKTQRKLAKRQAPPGILRLFRLGSAGSPQAAQDRCAQDEGRGAKYSFVLHIAYVVWRGRNYFGADEFSYNNWLFGSQTSI